MTKLLFYIFGFIMFTGCSDNQKEEELAKREENLSVREKEFKAKETEYKSLLAFRDSIQNSLPENDAESELPAALLGKWSGKMICTESSCSDHVVGDQRTDMWEFYENALKITTKTGTERLFNAKLEGDELKLISEETSNVNNRSEITLILSSLKDGRIKGTRKLIGKDSCIAIFSVELEKAKF